MDSQINTLTHIGFLVQGHLCLCVFPLLSTWLCCAPHCAPSMPPIWNQTPMDQYPAGVIRLSFSGATADAEDIPLGSQWCVLCINSLYLIARLWICPLFFHWELVMSWRAASNSQCFLLRQYIDRWKLGVFNTWWCNLPFRSLLSVANWLNCINREACSVGQRGAGMRDMKGMREGSSWCEGVSPHNGGKIWSGIIKSNNQQRWSCEVLFLPRPASILGCDITHSPVSINNSRNAMQGHGLHTFDGLVLFQSLIKSLLTTQKVGFSAITCAQLS